MITNTGAQSNRCAILKTDGMRWEINELTRFAQVDPARHHKRL